MFETAPEVAAEAQHALSALLDFFQPELVVSGDAPHVDQWARLYAQRVGVDYRTYTLQGSVLGPAGIVRTLGQDDLHPLRRNAVMVTETAAYARKIGAVVRVFGLEAAWSVTKGTAHTLTQARKVGLPVVSLTFER